MQSNFVIVKKIIQETYNTKSFLIESNDKNNPLKYIPGQFISIIHPQAKEIRRSYSFASCPETEIAKITVKRIDNGILSRFLFDHIKEGDKLPYSQIKGLFTLPEKALENKEKELIFFAAGSGITPCISIIKNTLPKIQYTQKIRLIYSNNTKESTIFLDEIISLEKEYSNFYVEWMFSNAENILKSRLNNFVIIDFIKDWTKNKDKKHFHFFICGPIIYMDTVSISLLTEGFKREQIRKEIFYNLDLIETNKELPPDKNTYKAKILLNGEMHQFEIPYPKSIMQAAHDYGIQLPFSCESGQCGSCVAQIKSGEVWMSYNEVLMPSDIERGICLTCVGHPINDDISLEFNP